MDNQNGRKEIDLLTYWRIIRKRRWVMITFTAAVLLFTGIFSFLAIPKYRSTATLQIDDEHSRMLSLEETFGYQAPIRDLRFYNTQLRLLKSKSLAERVGRKLNLLERSEYGNGGKSAKNVISTIKELVTLKWLRSKESAEASSSRRAAPINPYSEVAEGIRNGLEVTPVRETKLVEVSYVSSSPILAAELVNTLSEEFITFSVERRYMTTQLASDFLGEQIANLRQDLAAKEREINRYGREKNLDFLNESESTTMSQFADINQAFTRAQIDRINAQAKYQELKDLDVNSMPQYITDPVIQELKAEYTRVKSEYEEKGKIFMPDYPEMIQLKARMDNMTLELQKTVDAAESEYRTTMIRESSLKKLMDAQKEDVRKMNSNAILYNSLKIEVENKRNLLNSLVERQNETLVSAQLEGIRSSSISIIDRAEVPAYPFAPKKGFNLLLAMIFGIFAGGGLCILLEQLDNTVKDSEDVNQLSGLPSLGAIPYLSPDGMSKKMFQAQYAGYRGGGTDENPELEGTLPEVKEIELINHRYPSLSVAEDYRTIRTSILLSQPDSRPKTIMFSSAMPQEGKSSTVVNMAVSFSQLGDKVLVVDADLRRPRLHRVFNVKNTKGLSGFLAGKSLIKDAFTKTSIENVWLLPSGVIPPNPAELLGSQKMKKMMSSVKEGFDVILIDTPPVLAVVDAVVVAALADAAVFVVKAGNTTRKNFLNSIGELKRAKAHIIGVLLNELRVGKGDYYYMDYYRSYQAEEYSKEEDISAGE